MPVAYDFEPEERRVDVGALELGYLDYGGALGTDPRGTVVLLHGQADSAWSMHPIAVALADRYRVLSLHHRGHGTSDRGAYALLHFVGDLAGAIEAWGLDHPIIIGHSLGGQTASQFCGLYPDTPRALVLVESLGPPVNRNRPSGGVSLSDDEAEWAWARWVTDIIRQPYRSRPMASLDEAVERFRQAHDRLDPDRARHLVERSVRTLADGRVEWAFDPATRDWLAGHDHDRAEQRWRGIRCPVQVILGAEAFERFWRDRRIGGGEAAEYSEAERDARLANFPEVDFVELPGAGHMVQFDTPDALNAEIARFLDGLEAGTARGSE